MRLPLLTALVALSALCAPLHAEAPSIHGRILDPDGLPLPGVTVTVRMSENPPLSTSTDEAGQYALDGLTPGRYDLEAYLDAFAPVLRHDIDATAGAVTVDLQLALASVREDVTVTASSPDDLLGSPRSNAPVTATREVMDIAMLPNSQIDDVLPLMPNVVRGPDGLISVAGAPATSGGLFVNTMNAGDPIAGGAGITLPLEAVDTMQVFAGGAPAELGGATGGFTSVQTRSGTDHFHMTLNSFFPRLLFTDSGPGGIEFWDPNVGFGGPIVRGRITYQDALSYRYDRNSFTTLAGPDHNLSTALLSWTQVDARLGVAQHLHVSLSADPRDTDRAHITAFTPGASAPRLEQGGWSSSASDTLTARNVLIDLSASVMRTRAAVTPHGSDPYVMTHELTTGSYFDQQTRNADRIEGGARFTWSPSAHQAVTTGATIDRTSYDQHIDASVIVMQRSDTLPARTITFLHAPPVSLASATAGVFAEDMWTARPWLTLEAGMRYDRTTTAGGPGPGPRIGWTFTRNEGRTTFRGSAGLFTDTLPLAALGFGALPAREVAPAQPDGESATSTSTVVNVADPHLRVGDALRWDMELNRRLGEWLVRVRYEERRGSHELVIDPVSTPIANGTNNIVTDVLSSAGMSRSKSFEATAGFRSPRSDEWYVSYVRAATSGNQNGLIATEGLLRVPFVQLDQQGPLPSDVPHRLLAWGIFHLPTHATVAPFLEARSGFPFTAIDDAWLNVGAVNVYRLPWSATLDLSTAWIIGLPRRLPQARVGIKLYNIVSAHTERDVQRDIERADFATRYNPMPRDFSFVFELLWGRHHVA